LIRLEAGDAVLYSESGLQPRLGENNFGKSFPIPFYISLYKQILSLLLLLLL
jgi:hypothetical protein